MTRIAVSALVPVPHEVVWSAVADLGSHRTWMSDVRAMEFLTEQRSGVGTRLRVETVVGPFRTTDVMEVVEYEEGRSIVVVHQGVIKGRGTLSVTPDVNGAVVGWDEHLTFPWWLGGRLSAWLARPLLARVWRDNLGRLEESLVNSL